MAAMTLDDDLQAAAAEEMDRALDLSWRQLKAILPWGDSYEGLSPGGREVCFERAYLWAEAPGGDILCEVTVSLDGRRQDPAARLSRRIARP